MIFAKYLHALVHIEIIKESFNLYASVCSLLLVLCQLYI